MAEIWGKVSSWIFLIGIAVAIIVGLAIGAHAMDPLNSGEATPAYIAAFLGVLGLIVGILTILGMGTITKEEIPTLMMAAILLIAIGGASQLFSGMWKFGDTLVGIVSALSIFVAPIAGLIAIKAIWDIGKD